MTRTPAWLAEKIAQRSRAAHPGPCHGCGAPILAGLNDDWCAWGVVVDQAPVGYLEAVAAHLAGATVHALMSGDLHRLDDLQLISCHRNGLPLHLPHDCPAPDPASSVPTQEALIP